MRLKEKRLRLILDDYKDTTVAGNWIIPLNPDNIKIEFTDMGNNLAKFSGTHTIYLNSNYEVSYLFPCYIRELWYIKQRREHRWRYWFYKLFTPQKINKTATEQATLASNWICGN